VSAKTRHVFGRVRVKMDKREFWFEQRKEHKDKAGRKMSAGIYFRPLHGQHWQWIDYQAIYDLHISQFPLPI
jgi:hypothetical protein